MKQIRKNTKEFRKQTQHLLHSDAKGTHDDITKSLQMTLIVRLQKPIVFCNVKHFLFFFVFKRITQIIMIMFILGNEITGETEGFV